MYNSKGLGTPFGVPSSSLLVAVIALCSMTFEVMSPRSHCDLRANNLQPREKRLIIVFPTVDTAEQGVGRAEGIEARGDDYANGAEVMRFKSHLRNQKIQLERVGFFHLCR